ncbi:hypothetical protein GCM10027416_29420 [Okibacterium endophyticum]
MSSPEHTPDRGPQPSPTLAVIGLGHMGAPMAEHWLRAGLPVNGFDLDTAACDRLRAAGGTPASDAALAARGADIVVLMLPNSLVVDSVLDRLDAAGALAPGATVVDMGSSDPAETQRQAARLAERGVRYVDAPVSGGVRGAVAGTLTIMTGGEQADVDRVRPVLELVGTVHHVGPIGAGDAIKALNNLVSAGHLWLTSEAVLIAERVGISAEAALAVFNSSSARSGSSEVKWPAFILTGSYDSGFAARLMLKDTRIATELARSVELPSTLGDEIVRLWGRAVDDLDAAADHTEIARWLRASGTAAS